MHVIALLLLVTPVFARAIKTATSPPPRYTLALGEAASEELLDLNAFFPPDERPHHTTFLAAMAQETAVGSDDRLELR